MEKKKKQKSVETKWKKMKKFQIFLDFLLRNERFLNLIVGPLVATGRALARSWGLCATNRFIWQMRTEMNDNERQLTHHSAGARKTCMVLCLSAETYSEKNKKNKQIV